MADTGVSTPEPEGETPTQKQARLRREKRQKKMAESGEERLARIKALNGGVAPPAEVLGGPAAPSQSQAQSQPRPQQASVDDDPDEADIDTVSGINTPSQRGGRNGQGQVDPLTQAMFQMQQQQQRGGQGADGAEDDPMVKMMQQLTGLMGGNAQDPNDPNQPPQIPAALQALMGGMGGGNDKEAQKAPETGSAYLWRIVHAVFAVTLGIYITMTSTFNGTKLARSQSVYASDTDSYGFGPRLFTIFVSAELLLQSTRYFVEKGQLRGPGFLAKIANSGFVPEPYAQYIRIAGRYIAIAQTIMSDAMVVVFVLGLLAWWKGMPVA